MKSQAAVLLVAVGFLLPGRPLVAHHSFSAEFDASQPIKLTGAVTKFEWTNPHAHFYIDVKDPAGKVVNWNLELASPNMMVRNGWTRHSLKEGDQVTGGASRAKDGTATASADTILKSDGTRLTFMSALDGK